jgi:deoxyribose-phosphate aldolase
MNAYTYEDIAKMIDHSLVNPALTVDELENGCRLAVDYNVASVSIVPWYLQRSAGLLAGSSVNPGTTVGFPHGSHTTFVKVVEAQHALAKGARELDMVANLAAVRSASWQYVRQDIADVCAAAHGGGAKLKVIFENCFLNDDQKIALCEICGEVGVDWVKTSTGYAAGGCTFEDLALMRKHSPPDVQVKAAGGIRDLDALLRVRELGATRCGATRTAAMLDECRRRLGLPAIRSAAVRAAPAGY